MIGVPGQSAKSELAQEIETAVGQEIAQDLETSNRIAESFEVVYLAACLFGWEMRRLLDG